MMSRKEILMRKQEGKQYLTKYLKELRLLVDADISQTNLKTLEETDEIIAAPRKNISTIPFYKQTLPFGDKVAIKKLLFDNARSKNGFYLFVDYSRYCGIVYIENLEH